MTEMPIESFEAELAAVAKHLNARLVQALPDAGSHAMPVVSLEPKVFLETAAHLKPRAIYWDSGTFDARPEIEEKLHIDLDDVDYLEIAAHPELKSLLKRWAKHDGEVVVFAASFGSEGVLHTCAISPTWLESFEDALQAALLELAPLLEAAHHSPKQISPELHSRAIELAEHPAFNAPRASKEKRVYLAETLFSNASALELLQIVERATNVAWLRDSASSDAE